MCASRRIAAADRFVRSGRWLKGRIAPAQKFSGKRAGILGLGRIGTALAPRLQAFGMTIGYYDPLAQAARCPIRPMRPRSSLRATPTSCSWPPRAARACATSSTREILEALGPKGIFVNVARGWLVDEAALVEALRRAGSAPPAWMCSSTSPRCRKRCSGSTTWS